jgi:hypothetical protein
MPDTEGANEDDNATGTGRWGRPEHQRISRLIILPQRQASGQAVNGKGGSRSYGRKRVVEWRGASPVTAAGEDGRLLKTSETVQLFACTCKAMPAS